MSEPAPSTPAWRPDPAGRHAYRYFDGQRWTEHVSDGQTQGVDPLPEHPTPGPSRGLDALDVALMPFSSRQTNRRRLLGAMVASPNTGTVFQQFAFAALFLFGATLAGAGLLGASCHTRGRAEAMGREAMIASLPIETISADSPDAVPEGRLVHVTGIARPQGPVIDDQMGVSVSALVLARTTSMYQWIETCTVHDDRPAAIGSDVYVESDIRWRRPRRTDDLIRWTKCAYTKGWKDESQVVRADRADRYGNPPFTYEEGTHRYTPILWTLGKLELSHADLPKLPDEQLQPIALVPGHLATLPPELRERARIDGNAFRVGDRKAPKVGDLRIAYTGRTEMTVTMIGERAGRALKPHRLPDGADFFEAREGTLSVEQLAGVRRQAVGDGWWAHAWFGAFVGLGVFLVFWPLRGWGRALPGPALLTGAGVLLFVPLAATALYAATLARAWWASDRDAAVLAAVVAAGACALLLMASAARMLLRPPANTA